MIESADEFKRWFDAPRSAERTRKLREQATPQTWREIVHRFPELRAEVAWRLDVPLELLELLRWDDDEGVRWRVRSNGRWLEGHPEDAEPWKDDPAAPIQFRLTDEERSLLRAGLIEWGGPAQCTEELAVAMGFASVADLFTEGSRIAVGIATGQPLSRTDWTRALLATEIAFASDTVGSGWDWETTTGFDDVTTLHMIRRLQSHIVTKGVLGRVFGTSPSHQ